MENVDYLILGAGVSGIAFAGFLPPSSDYLILEKSNSVGGYCKTIKQDGFTWDYSGHFFHFTSKEIENRVLKPLKSPLLSIKKRTGICFKDKIIDFPFQKNIHQLPREDFIDCLHDLYFRQQKTSCKNFLEWLYGEFGASIVDKFIRPYNEKLYACSLEYLDVNAMGRFFPKASIEDIIANMKTSNNSSYNDHFIYPQGGAIEYINALLTYVDPERVQTGEWATNIDRKNKVVRTNKREIRFNHLVSSLPFDVLLKMTRTDYNSSIYSHNKVVVFNMGFDRPSETELHWLYVGEPDIEFYRVGFYDNILDENRMSLYVEIGKKTKEAINLEQLQRKILNGLECLGIKNKHRLVSSKSLVMDPAYVHITTKSIKDVSNKINKLNENEIYSIGRYGEWTYCSIEDNIISAKNLAAYFKSN